MNDRLLPRGGKAAPRGQRERGLVTRILLRSPKDTLAGALALTAIVAIIVNAMFLQAGRHPSPLFGTVLPLAKNPPPTVQKAAAVPAAPVQQATVPLQAFESPMPRPRPAEADARTGDPLGNLVRATSVRVASALGGPRPPAAVPAGAAPAKVDATNLSPQRIAALQRALTDYGYGQLKATGSVGAETQAAIQKFERERNLPVTGQLSERVVRELGLATGRSFE
jgi:hypothetical protein